MELISPQKQRVWKLPAVVNFSLGGMGTGFYLLALFVSLPADGNWLQGLWSGSAAWFSLAFAAAVFKLLGVALAALGFLALTMEAGQPKRGINLFRHLRRSWMSRETLGFFLFAVFAGLDWLVPNPVLRAFAAAAAFFLMLAQGFIVLRARGVTTWNLPLMPVYFIICGIMTGAGLMLVVFNLMRLLASLTSTVSFAWVGIVAAILNLAVWFIYLRTADAAFQKAIAELRTSKLMWQIVGVGHILPALLLVSTAIGLVTPQGALVLPLEFLAGALLLFGGVRQKYGIILEAGYLRAIVLSPAKLGAVYRERIANSR